MTQVDTALNLGWALLCIGAVLWHLWRRRNSVSHRGLTRVYRAVSVFLAAVALFPCISASDDHVRLQDLDAVLNPGIGFNHSHTNNLVLAAQLDAIEHGQASTPFVLSLSWCSFLLTPPAEPLRQHACCQAALSRGPPIG